MNNIDPDQLISIDHKNVIEEDGYYYVKANHKKKIMLFDKLTWQEDQDIKEKTNLYINVEVIEAKPTAVNNKWIKSNQLSLSNAKKLGYSQ